MSDQIIRRFMKSGTIADDMYFPQLRETYRKLVETEMRDLGYVPLYDIDPVFRTWMVDESVHYHFSYSMQGVYIGEDKSWKIKGVADNKQIPMNQSKSGAS